MKAETLFENLLKTMDNFSDIEEIKKEQKEIKETLSMIKEFQEKLLVKDYSDLIISEEDAMKLLGVGERTIRELRKKGEIGFVKTSQKKYRYRRTHIEEYLDKCETKALKR